MVGSGSFVTCSSLDCLDLVGGLGCWLGSDMPLDSRDLDSRLLVRNHHAIPRAIATTATPPTTIPEMAPPCSPAVPSESEDVVVVGNGELVVAVELDDGILVEGFDAEELTAVVGS